MRANTTILAYSRFQTASSGKKWAVVEIANGAVHGFAFSYQTAMNFVNVMDAGARRLQTT